MELDRYLGDGIYADVSDDGAIAIRTQVGEKMHLIFLEPNTQTALIDLIERTRKATAEFELAAGTQEIAD